MAHLTQLETAKPSNFDAHKPPEKELIDDCVHCGFCLPSCPTYVLWGDEMDSPRGRIYMMKKSSQGEAPLDQRFQLHMDNCLGCMACSTTSSLKTPAPRWNVISRAPPTIPSFAGCFLPLFRT